MVPNLFLLDNEAKQLPWKTETFQKNHQLLASFCVAEIHFLPLLFLEYDRSRIIKNLTAFIFDKDAISFHSKFHRFVFKSHKVAVVEWESV